MLYCSKRLRVTGNLCTSNGSDPVLMKCLGYLLETSTFATQDTPNTARMFLLPKITIRWWIKSWSFPQVMRWWLDRANKTKRRKSNKCLSRINRLCLGGRWSKETRLGCPTKEMFLGCLTSTTIIHLSSNPTLSWSLRAPRNLRNKSDSVSRDPSSQKWTNTWQISTTTPVTSQ